MKKVFISHPFISDPVKNRIRVEKICKYLARHDILPISPLHLFMFIEKETPTLRKDIMTVCKQLIDKCEEVWIFGDSSGCREEEQYAKRTGKRVRILYCKEKKNDFKRMMGNNKESYL